MTLSKAEEATEFEHSISTHMPRLYWLALRIAGDPSEAEDIVQETLLSAWRAWPSLRDRSRLESWLIRICANHSIYRRRQRLRRLFTTGELANDRVEAPPAFDASLLDVHRAFRLLSARQRAVVVLHLHYGYTLRECAILLRCRPGTARSHFGRAIATLRKELADE